MVCLKLLTAVDTSASEDNLEWAGIQLRDSFQHVLGSDLYALGCGSNEIGFT